MRESPALKMMSCSGDRGADLATATTSCRNCRTSACPPSRSTTLLDGCDVRSSSPRTRARPGAAIVALAPLVVDFRGVTRGTTAEPRPSLSVVPSDRAPGLMLGEGVDLPGDVELGAHVVVHAGTEVGAGARLLDHCVVGKPLALGAHSRAAREPAGPTLVGAGAVRARARWCWPAPPSGSRQRGGGSGARARARGDRRRERGGTRLGRGQRCTHRRPGTNSDERVCDRPFRDRGRCVRRSGGRYHQRSEGRPPRAGGGAARSHAPPRVPDRRRRRAASRCGGRRRPSWPPARWSPATCPRGRW